MPETESYTSIKFSSPNGLPAEYKDLLVRMLSIQSRIESEYMLVPERTLLKPLALVAGFGHDVVRHIKTTASRNLRGLPLGL